MKNTLKVIISLVLVLGLLATAGWYFLLERPDLTTGLLLDQADNMVQNQRYERAITYYSWAWKLEPQRDDIPILLSETYIDAGNYTKAEYTLVKAISNHPGLTELYVALCQTYVEQDKLLDAVQMLDRTTDPVVKAELDALRPAAPVISPESGYYTEYIDVSVQSDEPIVYLTSNGEYPSTDADQYTAPLTLNSGETTILAIAVSEDGLVSPVVRNGYTVGGVVEAITLSDPAIDETVRQQLALDADDNLMSDLLWSITHLQLPSNVSDLSDLQYFSGLKSLTIQDVSGMDFTSLSQIPALEELDLSGCTISSNSMQSIGSLSELKRLTLDGCALTDITALSQLSKLQSLCLSNNTLTDIGVVSLMLELESIELANNPLTSIAALTTCTKLKQVDITGCSVASLGSLAGKESLETLYASGNQIRSIDELEDCKSLVTLELNSNLIEEISVLAELPKLVHFEADQNEIIEIPDFDETNCQLVHFSINYNQVEDVSGLAGIDTLNYLNIDYNKVKDLLSLAENINLVQINAWDNAISEESQEALEEHSIILNYNPNYEAPDAEEEEKKE